MTRNTHDRTALHTGTENDLVVLLDDLIQVRGGTLPAGTELHTALSAIESWISFLESGTPLIRFLTADAVIAARHFSANAILRAVRSGSFTVDVVIRRITSASFTLDAVINSGTGTQVGSFTIDAIVKRNVSGSFTANAIVNKTISLTFTANAVIMPSFTADAVITLGGLTTIQWRSYDRSLTGSNILPDTPQLKLFKSKKFR